ncbi:MAG TPA: choice-of-anchor D domain-containing protein, partial [Candidatus Angelobacter sp.]|nr:choice-of-anchor D domain-containing protein [Candidatus Angelobacter sp.]
DSAQDTNAEVAATSIAHCDKTTPGALRMKIVGGEQRRATGTALLPGISNYYFGQDRSRWLTGIPDYASVVYRDIYPGINLSYHGEQGQLEYDFELQPGKSERPIRIQFPDARSIHLGPQGELLLSGTGKAVTFPKPFIFQIEKDTKRVITGGYKLLGKNQVGFWVGPHDPTKPLTIDPILLYSTNLPQMSIAVALDSAGNAYMTGQNATTRNVFINKLNADGTAFLYTTELVTSDGAGAAIAVDPAGNAYITGFTESNTFPTLNAFQPVFGNANSIFFNIPDAFVTKLDPTGALVYSTYLGGPGQDGGASIAVDAAGNAFVVGSADRNFPTSPGAFQTSLNQAGGNGINCFFINEIENCTDGFVTKFSPTGELIYSTYLGGGNIDSASGVAIDAGGNAYVVGHTESDTFPVKNAIQPVLTGIGGNMFLTKVNPTGTGLIFSTYFGGGFDSNGDTGGTNRVALDPAGNIYVAGSSPDIPTSPGTLQPNPGTNTSLAFITKFANDGSLIYSTHLTGNEADTANGLALDSHGNAIIAGSSSSGGTNDPVPPPSASLDLGQSCVGGSCGWIAKVSADGTTLLFFTETIASGNGVAIDSSDNAYVVGAPNSLITTPGVLQTTNGPGFITKLSFAPAPNVAFAPKTLTFGSVATGRSSNPQSVKITNNGDATLTFTSITVGRDFSQTNDCGTSIAGGTSCTVNVVFNPGQTGTINESLTLTDDAITKVQTIALNGSAFTGAGAILSLTELNFGSLIVGTSSPAAPVTLTNNGNAALNISSIATTGNFSQTNNCPAALPVAAFCTINVVFTPTLLNNNGGTLTITDDAAAGPTQIVSLAGTGLPVPPPAVGVSRTSLVFATQLVGSGSASQPIILTNTGGLAMTISSITTTPEYSQTNNCGSSLIGGASCTINVTFVPTGEGSRLGTLTLTDNVQGSPQTIALSGTGIAAIVSGDGSATVSAGQSAQFTVNLGDLGAGAATLSCQNLPALANCSFNPATVNFTSASASSILTISTTASSTASLFPATKTPSAPLYAFWLGLPAVGLLLLAKRPSRKKTKAATLVLLGSVLVLFAGCGGGNSKGPITIPGTPSGTFTVTVNAAYASGVQKSTTVTLIVQ